MPPTRANREQGAGLRRLAKKRYRDFANRLIDAAPLDVLEAALGEADEHAGIARMLEGSVRAEPVADPFASAVARARRVKKALLERAGGAVGVQDAARVLGVSRQAVDARRRRGTLLALPQPNGQWVYPRFQFEPPEIARRMGDVLPHFQVEDAFTRLSVLLGASPALGGTSPLEAIRAGDLEGAILAVRSYGEQHGG